jgi:hypothetical protein
MLVGMERDRAQPLEDDARARRHQLGLHQAPGSVWVLPLLAVIALLFPEVGGTLFGWQTARKLSTF